MMVGVLSQSDNDHASEICVLNSLFFGGNRGDSRWSKLHCLVLVS